MNELNEGKSYLVGQIADLQQMVLKKDAEIERLKHQISIYHKMIDICESKYEMLDFLTKKARAGAITEFVEKLKERMREVYPADIYDSDIDQIANELKGETE